MAPPFPSSTGISVGPRKNAEFPSKVFFPVMYNSDPPMLAIAPPSCHTLLPLNMFVPVNLVMASLSAAIAPPSCA